MATEVFLFLKPPPTGAAYYREAHPYGPDGSGGFNTDLAIEIDPAQLEPFSRTLAATEGLVRFLPGTGGAPGMLVLKPTPRALRDLSEALGDPGSIVFVYRNLDDASVRTFAIVNLNASGGIRPPATAQDLAAEFMTGAFGLFVSGGDEMGKASTSGGTGGWARMGFEIAFTPAPFEGSWARLPARIAPAAATRRLDPPAFYAAVAASTKAKLAAAHASHVLLGLPSRRTLIEIRDEYDEPFTDPVSIQKGTAAATTAAAPAGSRGTFVVETLPAVGPAPSATWTVSVAGHVLTELPSGAGAEASPARQLTAPAHLALQSIFMSLTPPAADEPKSWFVANTTPSPPAALPRFTAGNKVTPLRDGILTFEEYVKAIRTATAGGHFVFLAAWILRDQFPLRRSDPMSTFIQLVTDAAVTGNADVRALVYDDSFTAGNVNTPPVNRINALAGGRARAILDDRLPSLTSSHHQKFVVVNGAGGAVAFCGGIDVNTDRRDSPSHGAVGAFHDVHAKVEGPAVADIHRTFVDRWNDQPTVSVPQRLSTAPPPFQQNAGSAFVQVARTFSPAYARNGTGAGFYRTFAPQGSLTPLEAWLRAIGKAKKFIYIEDQYLAPYPGTAPATAGGDDVGVLTALRAALPRISYLLMVIPNHSDLPQYRFRRQQFIEGLRSVPGAAAKVHVFFLGRAGPSPAPDEVATEGGCGSCSGGPQHRDEIYLHSKLWIVDDVCAKIGSANQGRRSFTNDTEMDLIVVDGALEDGARSFARRLRKALWAEHLNLSPSRSAELDDHEEALSLWLSPPAGARIRPYDHNTEIESNTTVPAWGAIDRDGR